MTEADDDFFGPQAGDASAAGSLGRDVEKLRRLHVASGFRDHADKAREAHLQQGFDEGFRDGASAAARPAFWMGVAAVLDANAAMHSGTSPELRRARMEMRSAIRGLAVDGEVKGVEEAAGVCRAAAADHIDDAAFLEGTDEGRGVEERTGQRESFTAGNGDEDGGRDGGEDNE